MSHRSVLLFCVLGAVIRFSQASFVDFFSKTSLGPLQGVLGPSLPADSVYVRFKTCRNHFMLTRAAGGTVQASSTDECRAAAVSKGAHAYWYVNDVCELASLRYPLCSTRAKNFAFNVLEEYLSNGTSSDDAFLTADVVSDILGTQKHKSFRIEDPTIAAVRSAYRPLGSGAPGFQAADEAHADNFILLRDNGAPMRVDRNIVADPACFTNSTCGVPFFTSAVGDERLKAQTLIMHDVCSQRFTIRKGQVYYLLSHTRIGCEQYPTTYPVPGCSVIFKGFEQFGHLKAELTLVDFRGSDRCEGQNLKFLTFEGAERNRHNACRRPVKEVTTREGRIRVTLDGAQTTTRQKYGFIIKFGY